MVLEAEQRSVRPPVRAPEARPAWPRREDDPSLPARRKMAEILEERVTVDFVNADLEWVLNTLFILTGINIISDPAALADKSLTLHVENLPLREVLDYIIRVNEGIQLSFTGNAVWITASSGDDLKKLMIVKVYPIHHGLVTSRAASGAGRGGGGGGGGGRGGGARTPLRSSAQQRQQPQQQQGEQAQSDESYLEIVLGWLQDQQDTQSFPEGSEWFIDRQSNQLVVYTTPAGHDKIQSFLDAFDQPAIQVLIKARFLEVSGEDNFALGVTLDSMAGQFSYHGYKVPFAFQSEYAATPPGTLFASGNIFQVVGSRLDPQFQITLKALLGNRRTRILSEPQILAINNKEAFLDVTTEFSYITDLNLESYDTIDANGNRVTYTALVPQFDTEQVGFTLYVTPSVGRDLKTINLHLRPVIDSLAQGQQISQFQQYDITQPGQGQQNQPLVVLRPTIDQTSLETDVVLDDNGFVIIGGLIRNRYEVIEKKVPGLHRIPYLGYLFKSKQNQKLTSNLVVIVEAQIITQRGRTYRTEPSPDDGDVREGGANRAPGQVSELQPLPNSPRPPTLQPATAGQGAWRVSEQER
jgi:general secretion pathway protein D